MKKSLIALLLVLLVFSLSGCFGFMPTKTSKVVVLEKNIKAVSGGDGGQVYLVQVRHLDTGKIEIMEVKDSLLKLQFNSSDIYFKLKVGSRYKIWYHGIRFGPISEYRNITRAEK